MPDDGTAAKRKILIDARSTNSPDNFASGGDVIEWQWIEFFVIVAFVTTLTFAKINWTGKGLMIFIFGATEYNEADGRPSLLKEQAADKCNFDGK